MKSNFIAGLVHKLNPKFRTIAVCTFIVYFITSLCGHVNLFVSHLFHKAYFPRKSYLIFFDKKDLTNFDLHKESAFNLSGFKTIINPTIPYKQIDDIFYLVIATALVILFYLGYLILKSDKTVSQIEIVKWSVLFSLLMTISLPSHSSDLYGYIARGAQQTLYHQNPYLETVSEIKNYDTKPLLLNFEWPYQTAPYGPLFNYLTKLVVQLSSNNFLLSFINFKLLNLTIFLFILFFILKTNNTKDLYLISWNPLLLIHGLWNCHNDLISGVLLFMGVYLLLQGKYFWSSFFFVTSAGVKYVSLLLIPITVFYLIKNKFQKNIFLDFILGISCSLILITIFSIDYILPSHIQSLGNIQKILQSIGEVRGSLIASILTVIKYFCTWQKVSCNLYALQFMTKCIVYLAFGIFYVYVLCKKKSDLVFDITLVLFIFFAFIISKFNSWYLINVVILIPLLGDNLLKKILVVLSLAHVYALTFVYQAKILNFVFMTLLPVIFVLLFCII